jgi:hypothetical protein
MITLMIRTMQTEMILTRTVSLIMLTDTKMMLTVMNQKMHMVMEMLLMDTTHTVMETMVMDTTHMVMVTLMDTTHTVMVTLMGMAMAIMRMTLWQAQWL